MQVAIALLSNILRDFESMIKYMYNAEKLRNYVIIEKMLEYLVSNNETSNYDRFQFSVSVAISKLIFLYSPINNKRFPTYKERESR